MEPSVLRNYVSPGIAEDHLYREMVAQENVNIFLGEEKKNEKFKYGINSIISHPTPKSKKYFLVSISSPKG